MGTTTNVRKLIAYQQFEHKNVNSADSGDISVVLLHFVVLFGTFVVNTFLYRLLQSPSIIAASTDMSNVPFGQTLLSVRLSSLCQVTL